MCVQCVCWCVCVCVSRLGVNVQYIFTGKRLWARTFRIWPKSSNLDVQSMYKDYTFWIFHSYSGWMDFKEMGAATVFRTPPGTVCACKALRSLSHHHSSLQRAQNEGGSDGKGSVCPHAAHKVFKNQWSGWNDLETGMRCSGNRVKDVVLKGHRSEPRPA